MNDRLLKLAYDAGLYAQGTPDSWDEEALRKYGESVVQECINELGRIPNPPYVFTSFDQSQFNAAIDTAQKRLKGIV